MNAAEIPEPCSCDEALALRAELERARQVASDTADILGKASAERQEARDEARALRTELARTRFVSVVRGKCAEGWSAMLQKTETELARVKAELAEANAVVADKAYILERYAEQKDALAEAERAAEAAEKRANEEALTHDNLLEEVESYRDLFLAEQEKRVQATAALADNAWTIGALRDQVAEAKRAAETWELLCHGQEELGEQADALILKFQTQAIEAAAKMAAMEVSMNAAYTERNRLVAFMARICLPGTGIRRTDIEGWDPAWHGCVFIETVVGQMSWHYHESDAHLFADLPAYEKPWDGHTTAEKYERLWRLTELTAAIP